MISQSKILRDKLLTLEDPIVCINFTSALRKVIQETSGTWKAIVYLKQTMITTPCTGYRIGYDEESLTDVVTWMTPVMKNNLVRYRETMFLDAQTRQYN